MKFRSHRFINQLSSGFNLQQDVALKGRVVDVSLDVSNVTASETKGGEEELMISICSLMKLLKVALILTDSLTNSLRVGCGAAGGRGYEETRPAHTQTTHGATQTEAVKHTVGRLHITAETSGEMKTGGRRKVG